VIARIAAPRSLVRGEIATFEDMDLERKMTDKRFDATRREQRAAV
jgi:hypothetical protein